MPYGVDLNRHWRVNARHALYREDGKWYHILKRFPAAYFDKNGYVLFETELIYRNSPYLRIGIRVNITRGISNIPGYVRVVPDQSETWRIAVLAALHRISSRHETPVANRRQLIEEELEAITTQTQSRGSTPEQTLSRVLQELRDQGLIHFFGDGNYLLLDSPFSVDQVDLPDDTVDTAIHRNSLRFSSIPTSDETVLARRRIGDSRLRRLVLNNYDHKCALCDVNDDGLLVTSHIVRWADDDDARGDLTNLICLCKFHDPLFEQGYIAFTNELQILKKDSTSNTVSLNLDAAMEFRMPFRFPPAAEYLRRHRQRTGNEPLPTLGLATH